MKLTYRGVEYDSNPPMLEVTESEMGGKYRGQPFRYTYVRHVPIPQPVERLTYRGAAYQTTRQGQILQVSDGGQVSNASVVDKSQQRQAGMSFANLRDKLVNNSPAAAARRQLLQESSRLHRENIARSLEHRLSIAESQGNEGLVQQLRLEMSQSL
ncbi:MAG: protein of unknown function (DUF4278) [Phormidesmis priestleyi Ana]|uniref:DUF4278 domain-containing protein n=1 Tax=Phormidesmis priestleyi Ana TaxID=1666911 RepID=A0A0P7Z003_9CYAN|nr:MAG: protein of unknown function (DUF4278) [Phormidesmis priestleyi Ana]